MKPFTPRPYQEQALAFLRRAPRANLFAGMGMGKTVICETLVAEMQSQENTLVLAPLRVARKTWSDESSEWAHLQGMVVAPIVGSPLERAAALKRRAHIHTMNYENVEWLIEQLPESRWPFTTVIADESARLKSFRLRQGGKRAAALAKIAHRTDRWINLTGTPAPNGLLDLWGQQYFIDRGEALGRSYTAFEARWFYKEPHSGEHGRLIPHARAQAEIEERMRPTTLALQARDWFDLKEPVEIPVRVHLPAPARREYRRMARELLAYLTSGEVVTAVNAAAKSTKLLQLASGAIYTDGNNWSNVHDEKIEALRSIVLEAAGAPILVSYAYRHELARILAAFPQARRLDTRRDEDDWNAGRVPILVTHPGSAGHGLNLQHGGNILVRFGHTWNQEHHAQVLERIGPVRQMQSGYDRPVLVYSIIAEGTADEAAIARVEGKTSVADALMASLRAMV